MIVEFLFKGALYTPPGNPVKATGFPLMAENTTPDGIPVPIILERSEESILIPSVLFSALRSIIGPPFL
jgi:hypothetical protein